MSQFDALKQYLTNCQGSDVMMSFQTIDSILSPEKLPIEARNRRKWWENTTATPQGASLDGGRMGGHERQSYPRRSDFQPRGHEADRRNGERGFPECSQAAALIIIPLPACLFSPGCGQRNFCKVSHFKNQVHYVKGNSQNTGK